ncbi:MAG: alpha/beta hydrolase [Isosphaeraceae bacterium]|nr:alpha/beta hydrolase [Isosphaeraceae bacterium]
MGLGLVPTLALGAEGPGSPRPPDEPHQTFQAQAFGLGARSYWLFEPDGPRPERAPVVVFLHGWLAYNPAVYGAWIEHLARRGAIVIFPRYQGDWTTRPEDFLPNALTAIRDALDVLQTAPGRVRPDPGRFALIGHSAGGNLAVQLAAIAAEPAQGLSRPKAVVCVLPGELKAIREPDLGRIPAETLLVVVAAEHDWVVGDYRARQIFAEATAIPPARKEFVLYRTDRHGPTPLIADHLAPTAALTRLDTGEGPFRQFQLSRAERNVLDRYGFWRLADLTLEAAFAGLTLDEATDQGAAFRDLGRWGDGVPVTPPLGGDNLAAIPRVFPPNGARLIPWNPTEFLKRLSGETLARPSEHAAAPAGLGSRLSAAVPGRSAP